MDSCTEDFCFLCLKGSIDYAYMCSLKCNWCGRPSKIHYTGNKPSLVLRSPIVLCLAGEAPRGLIAISLYKSC